MGASLPPPNALGLPEKFTHWRPYQVDAVTCITDNAQRFTTPICPTGFGKSLMYVAAGHLLGQRIAFLTSTKGLQEQLMHDFADMGIADIRGRNSYRCLAENDGSRCDTGACIAGVACPLKRGGCLYFDALRKAVRAQMVVTNYAYWMSTHQYGEGLGHFDHIVCDEAHDAMSHVGSHVTVTLDPQDALVGPLLPQGIDHRTMTLADWVQWAREAVDVVDTAIEVLKGANSGGEWRKDSRRKMAKLQVLSKKLLRIRSIKLKDDNWVYEAGKYEVAFSPIWPAAFTESVLFLKIPKVTLTSASVCAKSIDLLGVAADDSLIAEYPHSFPLQNRLLIHIPTIRLNFRSTEEDLRTWLIRIDQIVSNRRDRKGIVHTVSYDRRNRVLASSAHADIMITHKRQDTVEMVERFKKMPPPAVLVSPSMTTGWDFPYSTCEYQIIGKLAYPDTRNKITKARIQRDKDYGAYIAMQQLVQACGRGVRAEDDRCESFIIDDNILWFIHEYRAFAPEWFHNAFVQRKIVPRPPDKLPERSDCDVFSEAAF